MRVSEEQIQRMFFQWLDKQYPNLRPFVFHIPNGGPRNIHVAIKLKAAGVLAGVADVFIMIARKGYHGLWIEFKRNDGRSTEAQKKFAQNAQDNGYLYKIAYSLEEAINYFRNYVFNVPFLT